MILIAFIFIVLYILQFNFEALWDAEAFKKGESNHLYKSLNIATWLIIAFICLLSNFLFLQSVMVILIYPFLRECLFDWILNHWRKLPHNYKVGKNIYKWLSGFMFIGLLTVLFKMS